MYYLLLIIILRVEKNAQLQGYAIAVLKIWNMGECPIMNAFESYLA